MISHSQRQESCFSDTELFAVLNKNMHMLCDVFLILNELTCLKVLCVTC